MTETDGRWRHTSGDDKDGCGACQTEAVEALRALVEEGLEAFRLTREYVGEDTLPNVAGWSHFDWSTKARHVLATPAPAADEAHAHEWHYYDGNETEGTEYRCRCGAMTDDQPAPTPAPPTPAATEPVAALRDELERRVAAVLTKFAGDEIMDLADRYAAARAGSLGKPGRRGK